MRVYNLESLIEKSKSIYNENYDYSTTIYITAKTKCLFRCKIHNHTFEQTPNHHFKFIGCPVCSLENKKPKINQQDFENKSKDLYGDIFEYGLYQSAKSKISLTCKIHNHTFKQTPNDHYQYNGCSMCIEDKHKNKFIKKASILHNNKYCYSKIEKYNNSIRVPILCYEHGIFFQTPNSHMLGKGCSSCAKTGFDYNSTGYFYIQELIKDNCCVGYKFGITKNIKKRITAQKLKSNIEHKLIFSFQDSGMKVFKLEQLIKESLPCNFLDKTTIPDGYTETLSPEDIFELENIVIEFLTGDNT